MRERLRGVAQISDRPTRIGKLKIGEVKEKRRADGSVVSYPSKLDYIQARDGEGNQIASFHDVYGEKPTEFRAVFPSDDVDEFYWESYRRYAASGLACHGNGVQAIVEESGESIDCPCQFAEGDKATCKPIASLSLFLYEVPALGVFQLDTGSINSIRNIRWFLTALPGLTGGQVKGVPFRVYIEAFKATHDGKSSTAYAWKIDLLPDMKPADVKLAASQAVDSFLLPSVPALDEAKPADLYPQIAAPSDDVEDLAVLPEQIDKLVDRFEELIGALTPGQAAAAQTKMQKYRDRAIAEERLPDFEAWLLEQIAKLDKNQGSLLS